MRIKARIPEAKCIEIMYKVIGINGWTKCKNSSQEYTLRDILGDANLVNISRIHTILTCWGCMRVVNDI